MDPSPLVDQNEWSTVPPYQSPRPSSYVHEWTDWEVRTTIPPYQNEGPSCSVHQWPAWEERNTSPPYVDEGPGSSSVHEWPAWEVRNTNPPYVDEGPGPSSIHQWSAWPVRNTIPPYQNEDPSCTHREWTNRGVTTTDLLDVSRSDEEYVSETDEEDQGRIDADSSDDEESFVACSLDPDHDGGLNALACAIRDEGVEWIENSNANNEDVPDPVEFVEFEDQRQRFVLGNELINQSVVDAYSEQNIDQGPPSDEAWANRTFSDKSSLVRALDAWHIAHNVQLKVVKSNTTRYTVRCVVDSCPWRLHASQPKGSSFFKVKTYKGPHTCLVPILNTRHRNCTSSFICQFILPTLKARLTMSPMEIQARVQSELHVSISYSKAWRAQNKALQIIYGSWEQSYCDLPRYFSMLESTNPGTITKIEYISVASNTRMFSRAFWAFGPSIHGWEYCRPLLSIDATHLYGKYGGHALIATGVDANGGLFPLAFAICEGENGSSWEWFLSCLRRYITRSRVITLISDRFKGLANLVALVFPPSEGHAHRWCLRHMKANMNIHFKEKHLLKIFYRIGSASEERQYYALKEELKAMDEEAWRWVHNLHNDRTYWAKAFDGGR
ncbi:uncharacterized protein LOC109720138 [Ananas comosus]|uniref:Uncharacterized protein LOC109720138 n=1 Tax=Ananas comosus TaxID=4615 RepID=A0A6P5G2L1_ANACO|nr:uncharacterized protein LOC109720138 [Ananas comosus]